MKPRRRIPKRAISPPMGAAMRLQQIFREIIDTLATAIESRIIAAWKDPDPQPERRDTSRDLEDRLRALHADIGHLVAPHRLSGQISVVAEAVDTRTAGQLAAATQLADTAAPSLSLISLRATPGVATAIQKFRSDNLGRITSLVSDQISELRGLLEEAESGSWRVEELRERIRERLDVTRSKADFLARDQTLKLNGQITRARQTQAGITHYTWSTSGDERVREEHEDLDGTIQAWDDPPVTNADGDTNHPGEDYQCRCVAIPIVPDLDTE